MANEPFDLKNNLIAMLGVQDLPEEDRMRIIDQASELVLKRVIISMLEGMSDEDAAEAAKLADEPEKLLEHMASKGADIWGLIAQESERLKNELTVGSHEDEVIAEVTNDTEI